MNKKMAAMFATMLISLSLVGAAYALWYDTLLIDGTVYTGTVDIEFSPPVCSDDETKPEVSRVEAEIVEDILEVTVYNAYPCITYTVVFDVHCAGSIPVHLSANLIGNDLRPEEGTILIGWFADPECTIPARVPIQLHYCDRIYGKLTIHLDNPALQGHIYFFAYQLMARQYNEPA